MSCFAVQRARVGPWSARPTCRRAVGANDYFIMKKEKKELPTVGCGARKLVLLFQLRSSRL